MPWGVRDRLTDFMTSERRSMRILCESTAIHPELRPWHCAGRKILLIVVLVLLF
jgi:hypothetical protein